MASFFPDRNRTVGVQSANLAGGVSPEQGSPASGAGLRESDIVVEFNCQAIAGIDDLHKQLTGAQVGVRSSLTVIRSTERLSLEIVPEESAAKNN